MTEAGTLDVFTDWYLKQFPPQQELAERRVAIKKEYPIVDAQTFRAADVRLIFPHLTQADWTPILDEKGKIKSLTKDGVEITTGIGWCTLRISIPFSTHLFIAARMIEEVENEVADLCWEKKMRVLGYGIQPLSYPDRYFSVPEYGTSLFQNRRLHPHVDPLTIAARDVVLVEMNREEISQAINILNALSGPIIWLFANSPVWRGEMDPLSRMAVRADAGTAMTESMFGGTPPIIFGNNKDLISYLTSHFSERKLLRRLQSKEHDWREDWTDYEEHIWLDARPRTKYKALEIIVPCSQKTGENRHLMALILGLMENLNGASKLLDDFLMRNRVNLRRFAICNPPSDAMSGLIEKMLSVSREGLKKRGYEEEIFLTHLRTRLRECKNPATEALKIFKQRNGMPRLIDSVDVRNVP